MQKHLSKKRIGPLLLGIPLALGMFYLQNLADQYFTKWKRVFDDFELAFPRMEFLMEYNQWIVAIPSICILLFSVTLILSQRHYRSVLLLGGGIVTITMIPILLSMDMWVRQLPAVRIAANLDLNSIPQRSDSKDYLNTLASSQSPREQALASAKLRFIGLQYRIQLVDRMQPDVIEGLIEIAGNTGRENRLRFLAAWVLLVVDRESEEAKEAIRLAMKAAANDSDSDLKSKANEYVNGHPIFHESP